MHTKSAILVRMFVREVFRLAAVWLIPDIRLSVAFSSSKEGGGRWWIKSPNSHSNLNAVIVLARHLWFLSHSWKVCSQRNDLLVKPP